jgi:hypothetical protein
MNQAELHPITQKILPLLRGMCQEPELLVIHEFPHPHGTGVMCIEIEPAAIDAPVINGRDGRTIQGIARILGHAFAREGIATRTTIRDVYKGKDTVRKPFTPDPAWETKTNFQEIFNTVLGLAFDKPVTFRGAREADCFRIVLNGPSVMVNAVGDVFWPFAKNNGQTVKIRPMKNDERDTTQRTREILRRK